MMDKLSISGMSLEDSKNLTDLTPQQIKPGVIEDYLSNLPEKLLPFGIKIVLALIVLLIGLELIKILRKILKKSLTKASVELGTIQFLDSCIKITLYVVLIFLLASWFGLDTTSAIAVLGSLGLTIGLAMQGSLANFAGGVLILVNKPFRVGDYIVEDTKGNEGTVTKIDIMYTRLVTIDNKMVVIPNGVLANSSLTNITSLEARKLNLTVGISYHSDIREAKKLIEELLDQQSCVLKDH
ncbi:MAG: mechanosensitive ion channel family protein, partial [Clostridia bacterium]|nr:mechanosensitive ion channel family protein [Clostridia bacterium]